MNTGVPPNREKLPPTDHQKSLEQLLRELWTKVEPHWNVLGEFNIHDPKPDRYEELAAAKILSCLGNTQDLPQCTWVDLRRDLREFERRAWAIWTGNFRDRLIVAKIPLGPLPASQPTLKPDGEDGEHDLMYQMFPFES